MSSPFVGEIRLFAGNFAPAGWLFCEGQLLPLSDPDNESLFNLMGTTYGGDGVSTFALPDLRGRLPVHQGGGFILGQTGGTETITLTVAQLPSHTHAVVSSVAAGGPNPAGSVLATSTAVDVYREATPSAAMAAASVLPVGGSQPHDNFQPYLCLSFIISRYGLYPPPS